MFVGLCRQVADEGKHYQLILSHLESLGTDMEGWTPEPEWVAWVSEFYAAGDDTLERVAAHNITGELGAMDAFDGLLPRVPDSTRAVLEKIIPDEKFHVSLGRMAVHRYATTADRQARVRDRVMTAFELEQKGRLAFERRLQQVREEAAANDTSLRRARRQTPANPSSGSARCAGGSMTRPWVTRTPAFLPAPPSRTSRMTGCARSVW